MHARNTATTSCHRMMSGLLDIAKTGIVGSSQIWGYTRTAHLFSPLGSLSFATTHRMKQTVFMASMRLGTNRVWATANQPRSRGIRGHAGAGAVVEGARGRIKSQRRPLVYHPKYTEGVTKENFHDLYEKGQFTSLEAYQRSLVTSQSLYLCLDFVLIMSCSHTNLWSVKEVRIHFPALTICPRRLIPRLKYWRNTSDDCTPAYQCKRLEIDTKRINLGRALWIGCSAPETTSAYH